MERFFIYKILGSLAALFSASAWAFSSILFRRLGEKALPLGMNLGKCIIGVLYLGVVLVFTGIKPVSIQSFLLLGVSGLLGIAFGDTFFFKALIYLGPRLSLLLGTLGPVFTVTLAVIFLREKISLLVCLGIFLTVAGVTWVLWQQSPDEKRGENYLRGIQYALLSMICTSIAIILAKIGVVSISALEATFIRLFWGIIGLALWGGLNRQLKDWLSPFKDPRSLKLILFAVLVAIFGGFYLFLVALKYTDASIVTILNSTTPLFILPMAAFILKEKVSIREVTGATLAVAGVVLIFIG